MLCGWGGWQWLSQPTAVAMTLSDIEEYVLRSIAVLGSDMHSQSTLGNVTLPKAVFSTVKIFAVQLTIELNHACHLLYLESWLHIKERKSNFAVQMWQHFINKVVWINITFLWLQDLTINTITIITLGKKILEKSIKKFWSQFLETSNFSYFPAIIP